ncbi:hypothetical protein OVA13_16890 [Pseudoxanthomonas sp. SL93]|uniref:hypothetical protein n=1 Tax=Pseudoxanthomonas sp. SL93 TaxID=2995142 RepID=UPI00226FE768|nr:hypothetical protein [Pseudoxanthomonas sp. SL93]WAC63031.1 hypothetical protein OVA13_16890 [Pseudoxanthomonas sp. SL93]
MSNKLLGSSLLVAAIFSVAGCRDRAAPENTSSKTAAESATATPEPAPPSNAVDEAKTAAMDDARLATAAWTRHACSLDMIDNGPPEGSLDKGMPHLFQGFVLDQNGTAAGDFTVVFKGEKSFGIPVSTGKNRQDVADFFKNPSLASAGFEFTSTLSPIPSGDYKVLFLIDRGAELFFCEAGKQISVK